MYELIIKRYVERLTINDIYLYAEKQGVNLQEKDAKIIYDYIKKYWEIFYKGNPTNLFNDLNATR
mgnify:CR=1 FL=1